MFIAPDDVVPAISVVAVFSVPVLLIWTTHVRKIAEIRSRGQGSADNAVRADVEALRQEVRALRETSTQYDISFDTALQRIESRVAAVEARPSADAAQTLDRSA